MAHRKVTGPDGSLIEYPIPGVDTAINTLYPDVRWEFTGNEFTIWDDPEGREPPTGDEIIAEVKREEGIYKYYEYERTRMGKYPDLDHQLDMLFHDIEEGRLDKTGSFYRAIKAVKEKYPKPEGDPPNPSKEEFMEEFPPCDECIPNPEDI